MRSKRNQERKIQWTRTLRNFPIFSDIVFFNAILPHINKKKNRTEEKTQEQITMPQAERENKYNEIVKQIDSTQKKLQKTNSGTIKIIDEKTGFGWKGLGSRRIIYDNDVKENLYEIIEPVLSVDEEEMKNKLIYLFRVRTDIDVFGKEKDEKIQQLSKALEQIISDNHFNINEETKNRIFYYILAEFVGYGKIDILMKDDEIEDISCDGEEIPIFIYHKTLESIKSNVIFKDAESLDSFVVKLSQMCGKQISVYEPIVDGKLTDGSRLQTTLAKTITKYSTFTIRKFREDPLTPVDLIANNTLSLDMAAYFWIVIEKGSSILFCGGTATGKTTMLNALSLFLPSTYKIVSIEDTREINLPHENWIPGTTRAGFSTSDDNKTGKDIDMFDLIKVALRQRPKVIIVGEVRGKEAYTLFQAMTTGHLSYSTIHASDMHALIQRLESPPIELPRALLTSLDLIVFLNSVTVRSAPVRRVTNVTEVIKLDPETNRLVTMTPFYWVSEIEDRFENTGGSQIIYHIKLQNGWDDDRLNQELQNRKIILEWMIRKKLRSYEDVGRVVADYSKDPNGVLQKIKEDPQ
jgi:flagellar protein FlaI